MLLRAEVNNFMTKFHEATKRHPIRIQASSLINKNVSQSNSVPFCWHLHNHVDIPRNRRSLNHKVYATRRRRANMRTDTYVLMEPGKSEEFVSEEELRDRLKYWIENWPAESVLPPDLARYETVDEAVTHLVRSACELEIEGEVGSVQWYEVNLEQ